MKRKEPEQLNLNLAPPEPKGSLEKAAVTRETSIISFDQTRQLRVARDRERHIQTLLGLITHFD